MSRIVIDARELRTSTGRYVERLLFYLQQMDNKNKYKVLLKPEDMEGWRPNNTNFEKIACSIKEFTFAEQTDLKKQIEGLKPALVHFPIVQQPVRYKGAAVTTIHDLTTLRFINPAKNPIVFRIKQKVYAYIIKTAAHKSKFVITPSNFVKEDLLDYTKVDESKIVVTYEAADYITDPSEPVLELEGMKFLMYVGRPTPHKNLWRLIEAYALLKKKYPKLKLALAGKKDFNYMQIEQKVKEKGIRGVIFTDFISEGQLKWMYEHCEAYVFPSLSEGFGLPGLEAMVHGAPVASSNASCLPEIYGKAAKYFDPKDVNDMFESIDELLSDPILKKKLISEGKKRAQEYSWETMAKQTLEVYKRALS
ncbi:MAG TPA: glycosyltransferase family 1 protein [Candidatus Saccharimonadales bacterium]|nr:glycosyltransferase family 1 protein [Candidatus Saccharimonadales bacterium]